MTAVLGDMSQVINRVGKYRDIFKNIKSIEKIRFF